MGFVLFCDGYVVTKTHIRLMYVLHVKHICILHLFLNHCVVIKYTPLQCQLALLKNKKDSDCGCLKILTSLITVLLSVMRKHPRYEFCGRLHVTYLVLVRTLLTWFKYVPDSEACFVKYIP